MDADVVEQAEVAIDRVFAPDAAAIQLLVRLTLYGHVQRPGEPELDRVRWVFHFRGDRIAHLGNSKIVDFPKR